jgi:hypothetical protein
MEKYALITNSCAKDSQEFKLANAIVKAEAVRRRRLDRLNEECWDKDYVIPSSRWRPDTTDHHKPMTVWELLNKLMP